MAAFRPGSRSPRPAQPARGRPGQPPDARCAADRTGRRRRPTRLTRSLRRLVGEPLRADQDVVAGPGARRMQRLLDAEPLHLGRQPGDRGGVLRVQLIRRAPPARGPRPVARRGHEGCESGGGRGRPAGTPGTRPAPARAAAEAPPRRAPGNSSNSRPQSSSTPSPVAAEQASSAPTAAASADRSPGATRSILDSRQLRPVGQIAAVELQLAVDRGPPAAGVLGALARLDQVDQEPRALQVGQELVAQADAVGWRPRAAPGRRRPSAGGRPAPEPCPAPARAW